MKKIIQFTMLAFMICIKSYGRGEQNQTPVTRIITDLQSRSENFHSISLFHSSDTRSVAGIGNYIHLLIYKNELRKLFEANYQSVKLEIPLSSSASVKVLLTQHEILTGDFKVFTGNSENRQEETFGKGVFYYGIVENQMKSMVAFSVFANEISCVISDQNGNWNLGPLDTEKNEYGYYNDRSFKLPLKFSCATKDLESTETHDVQDGNAGFAPVSKCVKIFIDADYDFYLLKSSDFNAVIIYVLSVFNVESTIYANESLSISIAGIMIWNSPDPFDLGNLPDNLHEYTSHHVQGGGGIDLFQLFAVDPGYLGGIAWIDGVCSTYIPFIGFGPASYCNIYGLYSLGNFNFPTYTMDVLFAAHEVGHNLGSRHTHWCGWSGGPIDDCACQAFSTLSPCPEPYGGANCMPGPLPGFNGGTIMSYCHGLLSVGISFVNGFGVQPGNVIRSGVSGAGCLDNCTVSCLSSVNVANPITSGNTVEFESVFFVYGSSSVQSGANVTFKSDTVILQPGFIAESGSTFRAYIGPCTSLSKNQGGEENSVSKSRKSTEAEDSNGMTLSPNPFHSNFELSINLNEEVNSKLILYNSSGVRIKELVSGVLSKGANKFSFDGSDLSPGIYVLEIYLGESKIVKRIVKM